MRHVRALRIDDGDHALVGAVSGQRREPRRVDAVHRDAGCLRPCAEIPRTRVVARRVDIDRFDRLRPLAQARDHRVEAEQGARGGHVDDVEWPGRPSGRRPSG